MRDHAVAAHDAVSRVDARDAGDRHALPTDFERLAARAVSRRSFLSGSAAFGATAFVLGAGGMPASPARAAAAALDFTPVGANGLDTVTVPEGYGWQVVARWGDPLWSDGPAFDHATRGTGASQEMAFGDNCDGMALFVHEGRSVLAVNNEYTNLGIAFAHREIGEAGDRRRRAQEQGRARRLRRRDRPAGRRVANRPGFALQPAHHPRHADGDHGARTRPRPREDGSRSRRHDRARHLEQLRQWADALGHLSCLRRELQRLLLVERSGPRPRRGPEALRHQAGGQGLRLGDDGRALRHREAPQRAQPCGLRGGDRPARPGFRFRRSARRSAASSTRTRR